MKENQSVPDMRYRLSPLNLENPSNAHDFLIVLTGNNKKVLELGPASGYMSKVLKDRGCYVTGIEIDPELAKKAEKFLDGIIVGDIEELDLHKLLYQEKYDIILIGDVLEHLKEPKKLLQKLHQFLNTNGCLVCSIPNIAHGSMRIKLLNGEFRYRPTGLLDETHLRFFTLDSILSLFHSTGYSITDLRRVQVDIFGGDGADLKPYIIPGELIESILMDPESTTFQYVFQARPNTNNDNELLEWLKDFPKDITTEQLKNKIEYNKGLIEKLQKINLESKKIIQDYVDKINLSVKNIDVSQKITTEYPLSAENLLSALQEKESLIADQQSALQEKEYQITNLQTAVTNYQNMITDIHQSFILRALHKYDRTIGKIIPLRPKKYAKSTKKQSTQDTHVINKNKATILINYEKKDVICFPIIDWHYRYQRPQHLMTEFAKNGHRVFYLTVNFRKLDKPYEISEISHNVFQIELNSPKFFDLYKDVFNDSLISDIMQSFKILQNELKLDAICFVEFPTWTPLVLKLKKQFNYGIIFDCLDDFTGFGNVIKERDKEEKILLRNSDLVITTSSYLLKKVMKETNKVLFLPNAGEFDHFNKSSNDRPLKNYKKPIIGYFGSIADWFDDEVIEFVAEQRPNLTFVFIGHTFGSDIRRLQKLKNVHFLGERPYSELPKYLHDFDVCLIPFKVTSLIEATHPVKIYEYLSAGKPVVATNMPELLSMTDLCYVAKNKEDFLNKIDLALKENDEDLIQGRIEFASKNTWDQRFSDLYAALNKIPFLNISHHD